MKDIVDTAVAAGKFKTLMAAVQAAGLVETLKGPGPLTVFAPADGAFGKLPLRMIEELLRPGSRAKLRGILTQHVVHGNHESIDLVVMSAVMTVRGQKLPIDIEEGLTVGGANLIQTDIACSNGVIHSIDAVLLPQEFT